MLSFDTNVKTFQKHLAENCNILGPKTVLSDVPKMPILISEKQLPPILAHAAKYPMWNVQILKTKKN